MVQPQSLSMELCAHLMLIRLGLVNLSDQYQYKGIGDIMSGGMKTIRIVNKTGVAKDTRIYDANTGQIISGVRSVEILPFDVGGLITARLEIVGPELDLVGISSETTEDVTDDRRHRVINIMG